MDDRVLVWGTRLVQCHMTWEDDVLQVTGQATQRSDGTHHKLMLFAEGNGDNGTSAALSHDEGWEDGSSWLGAWLFFRNLGSVSSPHIAGLKTVCNSHSQIPFSGIHLPAYI